MTQLQRTRIRTELACIQRLRSFILNQLQHAFRYTRPSLCHLRVDTRAGRQ